MDKMVNDHEDVVKRFEKQTKNADDLEVLAFANKTLPKLQAHLAKAKEIKKMVK
jgi:putative membrane protein